MFGLHRPAPDGCVLLRKLCFGSPSGVLTIFKSVPVMLSTTRTLSGIFYLQIKGSMRAQVLRLTLHFLVGIVLGAFLLPEGAAVVLAAAVVAAGLKAFYDYLSRSVDLLSALCLVAGALAVVLFTA